MTFGDREVVLGLKTRKPIEDRIELISVASPATG